MNSNIQIMVTEVAASGQRPESITSQKHLFDPESISISPHAFSRFCTRTGISMLDGALHFRERLENAESIEKIEDKKVVKKRGPSYFLQDLEDKDIVYVLRKNRHGDFFVATVLFPLKVRIKK
jgi:hypothetical protein